MNRKAAGKKKQEIADKRKFLCGYLKAKEDIVRLKEQLTELESYMSAPASARQTDEPRAKKEHDLSDYSAKLEQMRTQIEREQLRSLHTLESVRHAIEHMDSGKEKDVLTYRYIRGYSWTTTAELMGYTVRQTFNIHGEALRSISLNFIKTV